MLPDISHAGSSEPADYSTVLSSHDQRKADEEREAYRDRIHQLIDEDRELLNALA
ncbi:hypothetical protein ACFQPA_20235 [Halomarina halobia]|uniref:Uncharacterized protein n=1 Tax=Halomarina halobia TaxID=3033386 RepID=A0ABD6AFN3_9EURY|nr:hypothetical protein [Halomarina sp. PSR21]